MAGENVTINLTQDIMSGSLPESYNERPEILTYYGENKFCPLCRSPISLFFINLHDKLPMCENQACEFPFGHEKLRVIKPGEIGVAESFCVSGRIRSMPIECTSHVTSGNALPETDKMGEVLDDIELPPPKAHSTKILGKRKAKPEAEEEQIMRNIEDIKELNVELLSLNDELSEEKRKADRISNEKWIKNLKSLQEISGVQLLRPEEMGLLKKEEPVIGLGELKIDIGPGNVSDVPSIRIEIHNSDQAADVKPKKPEKPKGKDPLPV